MHFFSSNGGVGVAFFRAKYLNTLEVRTTNIQIVPAFKVEENLQLNNGVITMLSASKLAFFFAGAIAPNATF